MWKISKHVWLLLFVIAGYIYVASAQRNYTTDEHRCGPADRSDKPFFEAVRAGKTTLVKQFLQQGADPNYKDDCGIALIHYAVALQEPDVFEMLVESGANVNDKDALFEKTPLSEAIGSLKLVKFLIKNRADVNLPNGSGETPLISAVELENTEITRVLLAAGAAVNYRDGTDRTAYSYAAQQGNKELKNILLEAGADPRIGVEEYRNKYGENAFFQAAADRRTDVVEAMLAMGENVNSVNSGKMTALMRATESITFDLLLAAGADINLKDNAGFTALIWSAAFKRNDFVLKLIAAGADVNAETNDGKTALFFVTDEKTRKALIKAGAKEK